jgi:hypothetical protein
VASTNASSRFNWPRSCKWRASRRSASSSFPLRTQSWNRRWQVWKGGYFSGSSRHCAPVPNIHNTAWSTGRVSCHGRPRLSARRCGRSTGSTTAHCSSVSSQRPRIGAFGDQQSVSRVPPIRLSHIYETGSSQPFVRATLRLPLPVPVHATYTDSLRLSSLSSACYSKRVHCLGESDSRTERQVH